MGLFPSGVWCRTQVAFIAMWMLLCAASWSDVAQGEHGAVGLDDVPSLQISKPILRTALTGSVPSRNLKPLRKLGEHLRADVGEELKANVGVPTEAPSSPPTTMDPEDAAAAQKDQAIAQQLAEEQTMAQTLKDKGNEIVEMKANEAKAKKEMLEKGMAKIDADDKKFREKTEKTARKYLRENLDVPLERLSTVMLRTAQEINDARIVTKAEITAYNKAMMADTLAKTNLAARVLQRNETTDMVKVQQQFINLMPPISFASGVDQSTVKAACDNLPEMVRNIFRAKVRLEVRNETAKIKHAAGAALDKTMVTDVQRADTVMLDLANSTAANSTNFVDVLRSQGWYQQWLRKLTKNETNPSQLASLIVLLQRAHELIQANPEFEDDEELKDTTESEIVKAISRPFQHIYQVEAEASGRSNMEYTMKLVAKIMKARAKNLFLSHCDIHEQNIKNATAPLQDVQVEQDIKLPLN